MQWRFLVSTCEVYIGLSLHGCWCYLHHPSSRVAISLNFWDSRNFLSRQKAIMHPISSLLDQELSLSWWIHSANPTTQFNASWTWIWKHTISVIIQFYQIPHNIMMYYICIVAVWTQTQIWRLVITYGFSQNTRTVHILHIHLPWKISVLLLLLHINAGQIYYHLLINFFKCKMQDRKQDIHML